MVLLTIHIRPKDGYTYDGRIKTTTVDSSQRLERIVADLKLDTKKGLHLFSSRGAQELALNSSLASNNIQSGDILETCSSPLLSCVLSAVLQDLEQIQKLSADRRTREHIEPLLGLHPASALTTSRPRRLEPWPDRWDVDNVKSRIMTLAFLKKVLQRHDRFADLVVPQCTELQQFYDFLHETVFNRANSGRGHNSMAHIFKPVNKDGQPTTCWQLLQFKLDQIKQLMSTSNANRVGGPTTIHCSIETFVKAERSRHEHGHDGMDAAQVVNTTPTNSARSRRKQPPSKLVVLDESRRKRRRITVESPSTRFNDRVWMCETCGRTGLADSICLEMGCPFYKQLACHACFGANHPPPQRHLHERIPIKDARAKTVLQARHQQDKQNLYCPEFASGPFAILCTLYRMMTQERQFSLTESRLKELAQPMCRSNLYDHEARGRNAFACVEGLMAKNLVRMERLPGSTQQGDGKYSLLPAGEALAKYCWEFEQQVQSVIYRNPVVVQGRNEVLYGTPYGSHGVCHTNLVQVIVDTREDQAYSCRLVVRCQREKIPCEKRQLPAGDYIFALGDNLYPLVVERKSWSDLADSVTGKAKEQRRLDCVKLGDKQGTSCGNGRCQLCKMKASGCSKIMFVIEGARCKNRDQTPDRNKCTSTQPCQNCRELQQRHGRHVRHESLEDVLYRLQVDHGCLVHFTRSYNETIESILLMREILGAGNSSDQNDANDDLAKAIDLSLGKDARGGSGNSHRTPLTLPPTLSYAQFCQNARAKRTSDATPCMQHLRAQVETWDDNRFVTSIFDGSIRALLGASAGDLPNVVGGRRKVNKSSTPVVIDLNKSFRATVRKRQIHSDSDNAGSVIEIGSDDDDSIRIVERPSALIGPAKCESDDNDDVNESQDSVQIVELPSANYKHAKREYDDNESQDSILIVEKPSAINKHAMRGDRGDDEVQIIGTETTPKAHRQLDGSKSELSLVLISGLYENDLESSKDLTELWKGLYLRERANGLSGDQFKTLCRTELNKLQADGSPILARETILFWLLFAQLKYSTVIHVERQKSCGQELKTRWKSDRQSGPAVAPLLPCASVENKTSHGTLARPDETLFCCFCEHVIGEKVDVEVTPCNHVFHRVCIHGWLSDQPRGSRSCFVCSHPLGKYKDDVESSSSHERVAKPTARTCGPVAPTSDMQKMREARLSKFEEGNNPLNGKTTLRKRLEEKSAASTSSAPDSITQWECAKCTYMNDLSESQCEICMSSRPGWACPTCTLQNAIHSPACSVCGALNQGVSSRDKPIFEVGCQEAAHYGRKVLTERTPTARSTDSVASKLKKIKCGACGGTGHNRATASADTCPMYNQEDEVKLRAKKKETHRLKALKATEDIKEIKEKEAKLQRCFAELQETVAASSIMSENEVNRLKREKARAEKQARKYG